MAHLARRHDADPSEAYQQKKRNGTLLASLASIHAQCLHVKERQHTALQLHARLHTVFLRATSSFDTHRAILATARSVGAFMALVDAFHLSLKRHTKLSGNIVKRVLHHRMFSLQLRSIHHQLSAFLRDAGADEHAFPLDWRSAFETALGQDEKVLHETLESVVKTSFLSHKYLQLSTRQQMEVLLTLRSERQQSIELTPLLDACLKLIYRSLVKLFGWDLNDKSKLVPQWFMPSTAIDFSTSRDVLTKLKPTYRGEMALVDRGGLKRHLVTMKAFDHAATSDVDVAPILEAFWNKYADIKHAHVLQVRGANFASDLPFIVRDYATQGTLGGHVARLSHDLKRKDLVDDALVWRLLVDACEGLLFMHEQGYVTHGGLKGSNLLVNHRGRACIADAGVRVLRSRLGSEPTSDETEYVRWLAPELLNTMQPSMAGDVYGFGMCILEVVSGERPWIGTSSATVEFTKRADDTALPLQPPQVADREWRLIQKMCSADPQMRSPLRQVHTALLELSRGTQGDVVPQSIHIDTAAVEEPEKEETVVNEFETESVSSYRTTIELEDNVEYSVIVEPDDADSMSVQVPNDDDDNVEYFSDPEPEYTYQDGGIRPSAVGLGLQTNGQMKNAIEYLAECHDSPPDALLPHLQLLRAFAKEEASAIHESGGIRVLNALFLKHLAADVRQVTLEIYSAMLTANQKLVADALVEQGVVVLVFAFFEANNTTKEQQNVCASLLLELMGQSDEAKRQIGDVDKKYIAVLEKNDAVHHRVLIEIKSVLARFKQGEGNEMLKEGFHMHAIQRFTEAIQLDRRRGIYYADRSLAFCHARRYHDAVEDAERCIRYNPFDAQGYLRYGLAMKHLHKYSEALAALRKGYQVNPNHAQLTTVMDEVQQLYNQQKAR